MANLNQFKDKNICIIGLMGSGKTIIGKNLGKVFKRKHFDTDRLIEEKYKSEYKILVAPGPDEINEAKKINAICILDNGRALDISQLSTLIKSRSFVVAKDTGPAHMAAHLDSKGLTLFGSHTSAFLQSIERENFKAIQVSDLNKLSAEKVFEKLSKEL